jgi:hypothetical protein
MRKDWSNLTDKEINSLWYINCPKCKTEITIKGNSMEYMTTKDLFTNYGIPYRKKH